MRCAFCHEALGDGATASCSGCGTAMHPDCGADLARCPTLGCRSADFARPGTRPSRGAGRRWWDRPVLFGLIVPLVAFGCDAALRVDPLIWGRPQLVAEPEDACGFSLRHALVLGGVGLSMLGLVLHLLGRAAAALPVLAFGVVVAAAHAVVFVPLLPLSLIGSAFGVGLLGLAPFVTLRVYLSAFAEAQRLMRADPKRRLGFLAAERWRWPRRLSCAVATGAFVASSFALPLSLSFPAPARRHLEGVDLEALRAEVAHLLERRAAGASVAPANWPPTVRAVAGRGRVDVVGERVVGFTWQGEAQLSDYPCGYSLFVYLDEEAQPPVRGTCYRNVEVAPGMWSQYLIKGVPPGGGPVLQHLDGTITRR